MLRLVVCDWNGTLFRDVLEETFFLGLCRRAALRALASGDLRKLARLTASATSCFRHYLAAKRRPERVPEHIAEIVEQLNEDVFSGLNAGELADYARRYAANVRFRLDERLLRPLRRAREEPGLGFGVVSSGAREGIEAALARARLEPDFVIANHFTLEDGRTTGFAFDLGDNKLDALRAVLDERGIAAAETMYVGDTPQDEPCLAEVGFPVVSFRATDTHRQGLARRCEAFAPADEADFQRHLRAAAGARTDRETPDA